MELPTHALFIVLGWICIINLCFQGCPVVALSHQRATEASTRAYIIFYAYIFNYLNLLCISFSADFFQLYEFIY